MEYLAQVLFGAGFLWLFANITWLLFRLIRKVNKQPLEANRLKRLKRTMRINAFFIVIAFALGFLFL